MYHDLSSNSPSRQFMDRANGPTTSQNTSSSRKRPAPVEFQLNRDQCPAQRPRSSKMEEQQTCENSMEGSWTPPHSNTFDGNLIMPLNYLNEYTEHRNAGQSMRQPYVAHGWPVMHSSPMNNNFMAHTDHEANLSMPTYLHSPQEHYYSHGPSTSHSADNIHVLKEIQHTPIENPCSTFESANANELMTASTCYPKKSANKRKLPSPIEHTNLKRMNHWTE